ncbi:unnamed protein product [Linum trigynum]|uniref:Uncharacterized protein n=1 Tax=Linum trigynum TaxID=586398 RepID=A0AAV2E8B6_9ROSI
MEQCALDTERSCSKLDPHIQAIAQTYFSFPRGIEETLRSIKKHVEVIEKACAQFAQDTLYATIQAEGEEEEANHGDVEEHTEVGTENSCDNHYQECPLVVDHTIPHLCSNMLGPERGDAR